MECPEVVRKLVRAYVWHEIITSPIGKLVCKLDAPNRERMMTEGFTHLFPTFVDFFKRQKTNFNVPSANIIHGYSKLSTEEPQSCEPKESTDCGICRYPVTANVGSLPCRHIFHMPCLERYLCDENKCPICRAIPMQGIDQADIEDTQARQMVRSYLRASKPDHALVIAEAEMERIVLRTRTARNPSMNKRNFAMAMVALADCYLRTGKYDGALKVAQNALIVYPQLSRLQQAEILRLQANALAASGGRRPDGEGCLVYTPAVEALFRKAFLLDPESYLGQIGDDFSDIGVWNPSADTDEVQESKAAIKDFLKGGSLRIHCL